MKLKAQFKEVGKNSTKTVIIEINDNVLAALFKNKLFDKIMFEERELEKKGKKRYYLKGIEDIDEDLL